MGSAVKSLRRLHVACRSTFRYEVKFQSGQECGGAYIKLITEESKPALVSTAHRLIVLDMKTDR